MGPQFHQSGYGRTFFEAQLPELTKAINRNAKALEENNNLMKQSLQTNKSDSEKE